MKSPWPTRPGGPASGLRHSPFQATLTAAATEGDIRAAQELADRAEGRARQAIEIEHTPLGEAFERMTRDELEAYATSGTLPA
jgi:hypothetical protein